MTLKAYAFLATLRLGTVLLCRQSLACLLPRRGGDHEGKKVTQQGRHRVGSIGPAKPVATQEYPLRILRMMVSSNGRQAELETLTICRGGLICSSHFLLSTPSTSLEGVIGLQRPAATTHAQLKIAYPPGSGQGTEEGRGNWASWLKKVLGLVTPSSPPYHQSPNPNGLAWM